MARRIALLASLVVVIGSCAGPATPTSPPDTASAQPSASPLPEIPTSVDIADVGAPPPSALPESTEGPGAALSSGRDQPALESLIGLEVAGVRLTTSSVSGDAAAALAPQLVERLAAGGVDKESVSLAFAADPAGAVQLRITAIAASGLSGPALADAAALNSITGLQKGSVEGVDVLFITSPPTYFRVSEAGLFVVQGPPNEVVEALPQLP